MGPIKPVTGHHTMKRVFLTSFLAVFFLFGVGESSADIFIDGFTDATNDRFTNSSSFIGAGLDFSGVGRSNRWGTLISNNVIITANHFRPSGEIAFYENNDPNSTPVLRNIVGPSQQIGNSDVFLSRLSAPVPSSVKVYDIATEFLSAPPFDPNTNNGLQNAGSFQDEEAFLYGISATSRSDTRVDHAVGRNRISGYIENIPFGSNSNNDSLLFIEDVVGDPDYVEFEAQFRGGDSGAPAFVERDGELLLLGINTFINDSESDLEFSGVTYAGNHIDEINEFIAINAVPEPGSASLILLAMAACSFVRRRSN